MKTEIVFFTLGCGVLLASTIWISSTNPGQGIDGLFVNSETRSNAAVPAEVFLDELPAAARDLAAVLDRLHSTSVQAFESVPPPDFGMRRTPSYTLFEESSPPKHVPRLLGDDKIVKRGQDEMQAQPFPSEAWLWLQLMHGVTSGGFVYRTSDLRADTVGRSRRLLIAQNSQPDWRSVADARLTEEERAAGRGLVVGLPAPSGSIKFSERSVLLSPSAPKAEGDLLWKIKEFELVSLLKHDPPVAYQNRAHTAGMAMADRQQFQTRPLNDIETDSLENLRGGSERVVAWNERESRLQMLGAIRAKDQCLKCHDVKRGELLGAFTYWIEADQKTSEEAAASQDESK